jgi:hypothetical protein
LPSPIIVGSLPLQRATFASRPMRVEPTAQPVSAARACEAVRAEKSGMS